MKVGDYVRTNLKNEIVICKVIDIIHSTSMNDNRMVFDKPTKFTYYVEDNKNYKSSQNIIDLIEVGDVLSYKDGSICRIMEITDKGYCLLKDYGGEQYYESKEWLKDIKSIVTKEQFSQMEYRIGE